MVFMAFLFLGSFSIFDLGLTTDRALALDACLSFMFFAQHSVMIRREFRDKLSGLIPELYYPAFYSILSGTALFMVFFFWQKIPDAVMTVQGTPRILIRILFFLSIAGFAWANTSLTAFDPFGVKAINRHLRQKEIRSMPLAVKGAYLWMRHPLYFFSLVMIWACPDLTRDRLMFNILWSLWIILATRLEERDLVAEFGNQYREYQSKVPMIIPYKIPPRMPVQKN